MPNQEATTQVKTFQDIYKYLQQRNSKPFLHVMNNECSQIVKEYITDNQTRIQLVEAHSHEVNAAEYAVQMVKNHLIDGLCTVYKSFPIQLWCELLHQCKMTLKLLRASRRNPKLSAYAILEGEYNFDKTPLTPPRTKALVYKDKSIRTSFVPHAKDAW